MKIESSAVCMQSSRAYSQSMSRKMKTYVKPSSSFEGNIGFYQNFLSKPLQSVQSTNYPNRIQSDMMSIRLQFVYRLIDFLTGRTGKNKTSLSEDGSNIADMRSDTNADMTNASVWTKVTETTFEFYESETTTFSSNGYARTEDGRTISFNVEVGMSRSFQATYSQYTEADYVLTDPLMINIGSDVASVSDMKFFFDLDCDGEKEEISFAGEGSGFLALDINGDGIINDGSELFGTKSGNGFADLALYDKDGNGWIDENDDIYERLKVWTKDEDGKDVLLNLKQADVGAIYLGNVDSKFALTNEYNYANAFIKSTGIYLKESGGIGTVNQLDLTS